MAARLPLQSSSPVNDRSRLSGTKRHVSQRAMAATGKLTQKAARQLIVSMRKPPIGGPSAVVIADAAAQVPIARPRTDFGKHDVMIARLCGTSSAAPIPWIARAAISRPTLGATAQASEATVKTTMPMMKISRRPRRSPRPPPTRIRRAKHQRVGVDHPLERGELGGKCALHRRQGNRDDGAVDEGERRGEDCGGKDERPVDGRGVAAVERRRGIVRFNRNRRVLGRRHGFSSACPGGVRGGPDRAAVVREMQAGWDFLIAALIFSHSRQIARLHSIWALPQRINRLSRLIPHHLSGMGRVAAGPGELGSLTDSTA